MHEVTRSKSATYHRLGKLRVRVVYESPDKIKNFPVLIKPNRGQGSQGIHRANTLDEVRDAVVMLWTRLFANTCLAEIP